MATRSPNGSRADKSIPVATLLNGAGTSCSEINAFDRSDMKAFGLTPAT
ncbi:MAG: hypothetical protein ACM36B_15330 [Bacteroidota bacterium]